jgi:hypothetical protein
LARWFIQNRLESTYPENVRAGLHFQTGMPELLAPQDSPTDRIFTSVAMMIKIFSDFSSERVESRPQNI